LTNFTCPTAGSRLHKAILEGFESLHKYIHSGDLPELDDVIPHEDFADYTAEDFVGDHVNPHADEDEADVEREDGDDFEPRSKRFRGEHDDYSNEGSNDYDSRYGDNSDIPSLLNINVGSLRQGQKPSEHSPNSNSPWEDTNFNSGASKAAPAARDRREGRKDNL
jgi:hypothetical protein